MPRTSRFVDEEGAVFMNVQPEVLVHPIRRPGLIADRMAFSIPPPRRFRRLSAPAPQQLSSCISNHEALQP
jgi:hypothetical protein